jgi:hypothetical protein
MNFRKIYCENGRWVDFGQDHVQWRATVIGGPELPGYATVWTIGVRGFDSRQELGNFFLHSFQTGTGAHPVSCPMGTGDCFPPR